MSIQRRSFIKGIVAALAGCLTPVLNAGKAKEGSTPPLALPGESVIHGKHSVGISTSFNDEVPDLHVGENHLPQSVVDALNHNTIIKLNNDPEEMRDAWSRAVGHQLASIPHAPCGYSFYEFVDDKDIDDLLWVTAEHHNFIDRYNHSDFCAQYDNKWQATGDCFFPPEMLDELQRHSRQRMEDDMAHEIFTTTPLYGYRGKMGEGWSMPESSKAFNRYGVLPMFHPTEERVWPLDKLPPGEEDRVYEPYITPNYGRIPENHVVKARTD